MSNILKGQKPHGAACARLLLATTMLGGVGMISPAVAAGQPSSGQSAAVPQPSDATPPSLGEIIVTAQKRSENQQKVPMSIQVLDTVKLKQLNIQQFQDYVKFMPSVTFQPNGQGPNNSQIFMRGISNGANGNHSGSLPTVGTYLDEMPVTTIGGTLDVHIYDIARIEVLPGPQGTLYGASSEAGTVRIITNKPSTGHFEAGYDAQVNHVAHGSNGYSLEGFVNIPVSPNVAVRLVGWDQHDAGFIDNVHGTRTYATSGATIDNQGMVKNDFNPVDTFGGRASLKWDLDDNWTIEPTLMGQDMKIHGVFGYEPDVGRLEVQHFHPDYSNDRFAAAALTVHGKVGRYDLTYAGGYFARSIDAQNDYTDYSIFYDRAYGSGAYWQDASGNILKTPDQTISGKDRFTKQSHEIRLASPATDRLRFIVGAFMQRQTHWVDQGYHIPGLSPQLSVPGSPETVWLTDEYRVDRDYAAFGEVAFDIDPHLTVTGGIRLYDYRNSLKGFFGFGAGYNALTGFKSGEGVNRVNCVSLVSYRGGPCVNLDKSVSGSGETHKINVNYKIDANKLLYATYSTGFRPGGVNRNGNLGPYQPDNLDNYEVGWKTSWLHNALHFNGAVYLEKWRRFQYSFLGQNLLTTIDNGPKARVLGVESSLEWRPTNQLYLSVNGTYNDAKLQGALCSVNVSPCAPSNVKAPDGQMLPYTPRFKGSATARYSFEFGDWRPYLQGSLVYQSRVQLGLRSADVQTYGSIPGFAAVDLALGAQFNKMTFELYVKNATDALGPTNRYVSCGSICAKVYPGLPRGFYDQPLQPRLVGVRFGQKF